MLCRRPWMQGAEPRPCGQCKLCRINRKRIMSNRIVLEAQPYGPASCIFTLTYDMLYLPDYDGGPPPPYVWDVKTRQGGLRPRDVDLWMKSFRWHLGKTRIRMFYCGEYGGKNFRPHYHVLIFGVAGTPDIHAMAQIAWGRGNVDLGYSAVTEDAAQYVAGYVLKGGLDGDPRLVGLPPPYVRMSQGIGRSAVKELINMLEAKHVWEQWAKTGDVPHVIRRGGKTYPLGRYLVQKLRDHFGITKEDARQSLRAKEQREKMLTMWRDLSPDKKATSSLKEELLLVNEGRRKNTLAKARLFARRETL